MEVLLGRNKRNWEWAKSFFDFEGMSNLRTEIWLVCPQGGFLGQSREQGDKVWTATVKALGCGLLTRHRTPKGVVSKKEGQRGSSVASTHALH